MDFLTRHHDARLLSGSCHKATHRSWSWATRTAVSPVTRVWPYAEGLRMLQGPSCAALPPAAERPANLLHGRGRGDSTAPGGTQLAARHASQVDSTAAASTGAYTPVAALPVGRSRCGRVAGGVTRMPAPTLACALQWGPRRLVAARAAAEALTADAVPAQRLGATGGSASALPADPNSTKRDSMGTGRRSRNHDADTLILIETQSALYGMAALRRYFPESLEALRQSRTSQSVRVYGRLPGGELHPYDVTLSLIPSNSFSARIKRISKLVAGMGLAHGAALRLSALPDGRVVVEPAEPRPADAASLKAVALTRKGVRDGLISVPKNVMARLLGEDLAGRVAGPEGIPVQLEGWGGDAGVLRSYNRESGVRWQAMRLSAWLRSNGAAPGDSLVFGVEAGSASAAAQGAGDAPTGVSDPATGPPTLTVRLVRAAESKGGDADGAGPSACTSPRQRKGEAPGAQRNTSQGNARAAKRPVAGRTPAGVSHEASDPRAITAKLLHADGQPGAKAKLQRKRRSGKPAGPVSARPSEPPPVLELDAVTLTASYIDRGQLKLATRLAARLLGKDQAAGLVGGGSVTLRPEGGDAREGILRLYKVSERTVQWRAMGLTSWLRGVGAAPGDSVAFGAEASSASATTEAAGGAPTGEAGPATGPRTLTIRLVRAAAASAPQQPTGKASPDAQRGTSRGDADGDSGSAPAAKDGAGGRTSGTGEGAGAHGGKRGRRKGDVNGTNSELLRGYGQPHGSHAPQPYESPLSSLVPEPNGVTVTAAHLCSGKIAVPQRIVAALLGKEHASRTKGREEVPLKLAGGAGAEGVLKSYRPYQWLAMRLTSWLHGVGAAPGDSVVFGAEASSASAAAEAQDAGDASTGMADPATGPRTLTVRLVRAAAASAPRQPTGKASPDAQRGTSRGHADGDSGSVTAAKGEAGGRGHAQTGTPRQGGASEPLHGYGQPHSSHALQSDGSPLSSLMTERLQAMLRSVGGLLKELGLRDGDTARMLALPDGRVAVELNGVVLAQSASTPPAPEPEGVTVTAAHLRRGKIAVSQRVVAALLGKEPAARADWREGVPLRLEGGAGAEGILKSYHPYQWVAMRLSAWLRSVGAAPGDTVLFGVDASCAPTAAEEALAGTLFPGVGRHAAGPRFLTAKLLRADGQPDAGRRGPPRRKGKGRPLEPVKLACGELSGPRPVLETNAVTLTPSHIRRGRIAVPIRMAARLLGKEHAAGLAGGGSVALRPEGGDAEDGVLRCYRITERSVQWQTMSLTAWLRSVGAAPGDSVVFGVEVSSATAATEAQGAGDAPTGVADPATGPRTLTVRLVRAAAASAPRQLLGKSSPKAQRRTSRGDADGDRGSAPAAKGGAGSSGTGDRAGAQGGKRGRRKGDASTLHAPKGRRCVYYGATALQHHFPKQFAALRQSRTSQSVRVYGRPPGGKLRPYDLTLYAASKAHANIQPRLRGASRLAAELGLACGGDVRLSVLPNGRVAVEPVEQRLPTERPADGAQHTRRS